MRDRKRILITAPVVLFLLTIAYAQPRPLTPSDILRVATVGDRALVDGEDAWLVWEGKDGVTFLVRTQERKRALVTLPR